MANNACVCAGSHGEGDEAAGTGCVCQPGPRSLCHSWDLCPSADPRLPLSHWSLSASGSLSPVFLSLHLSVSLLSISFHLSLFLPVAVHPFVSVLRPMWCVSLSVCPPPHCSVSHLFSSLISPFPRSHLSLPLSLCLCLCLSPDSSLFLCISFSLRLSLSPPYVCPCVYLLQSFSPPPPLAPGLCLNLPIHLEETVSTASLAASTLRGWPLQSPVWALSSVPWSHLVPSWV